MVTSDGPPVVAGKRNAVVGKWGEMAAKDFLIGKGFVPVKENVRTPYGEIDLVMRDGATLVFVEVKTRTSRKYGKPEEAVSGAKLQHMADSAEAYLQETGDADTMWRLDVVSVFRAGKNAGVKILHIPNVQA